MAKALTPIAVILMTAVLGSGSLLADEPAASGQGSPRDVFEQRIMPIFRSPEPASCIQCHLASVDLKDYIRPSHEQTFASLRDQGLIDLEHPEQSKILTLIRMGQKDLDEGARLIHEKTRTAEYAAFAEWIAACCADPALKALPKLSETELARPAVPDEVIRHSRKSRLVDSFVRNVWSQRMRCFPCHTPHELDESNPAQKMAIQRHREFMDKFGPQYGKRMDIFAATPEATVDALIEKSRNVPDGELPLINLEDPRQSLLVLKPTSKVPAKEANGEFAPATYNLPITHMGGLKMHVDDQSYKSFVAWMQDYARIVGNEYASVKDLPLDNWHASKHVVMVQQVPESWKLEDRVQIFVHGWDGATESWTKAPLAFTQGTVTPARNVGGALFLFALPGQSEQALDPEDARLPPGKYLLRAYVDRHERLANDPTAFLGSDDFVGESAVEGRWGTGFPQAKKVAGKTFQ